MATGHCQILRIRPASVSFCVAMASASLNTSNRSEVHVCGPPGLTENDGASPALLCNNDTQTRFRLPLSFTIFVAASPNVNPSPVRNRRR